MMSRRKHLGQAVAVAVLASGMIGALAPSPAAAGDVSAQQILDSLKSPPRTRSLSAPARPGLSAADLAFVKQVRGRSRSLTLGERDQMAEIAAKRPKIDLDINFEFDSASLAPQAEPQLASLGKALTSPELEGAVIMLSGHTDAKGSDSYNQDLSQRRAETVKRFLIEHYRIPAENLVTSGYGKTHLKNPANPFDGINRRVEIVNVAEKDQAANRK